MPSKKSTAGSKPARTNAKQVEGTAIWVPGITYGVLRGIAEARGCAISDVVTQATNYYLASQLK